MTSIESSVNMCNNITNIDDILKYRENNINVLEQLIPFIDKNANNKKYRYVPTWRRESSTKTNWILANKLHQTDTTKLHTSINDLLNKLSESNIDKVSSSIFELKIISREQMIHLVNSIISEAIINHKFTELYAKLCHKLMPFYIMIHEEVEGKVHFREILLSRCQDIFEEYMNDISNVDKTKLLGLSGMIGHLYTLNILSSSVLLLCFNDMYKNINSQSSNIVNALCTLMTTSGKEYYKRDKQRADLCMYKMETLKNSEEIEKREQFLVMDLLDLKKKENWI